MSKGLKYCPTPNTQDSKELETDVLEFCRRLRLTEKFFKEDDDNEDTNILTDVPLVRNKSDWNPPKSKDKSLEETIESFKKVQFNSFREKNGKSNLSFKQRNALNSLKNDKDIIIKEADKGGSVVVMNSNFYCEKIIDMLGNDEFYTLIGSNADNVTYKLINELVMKYRNGIMEEEIDYLTSFVYKTSYFYGLPKIHKSVIIREAIAKQNSEYVYVENPNDLTFRPIVGGPSGVTQRLSHFLDLILKPMCSSVKSFIKDDFDFLNHLPETVNTNSKLVSFDVVSLYTNIPHDLGIEAIKFWLKKCPNKIDGRFSHDFIIKSLEIILKRNVFYFNGNHYQQNKGTAMGTKVAPTYATLVLGYLEETLYKNIKNDYGIEFSDYVCNNFWRFLDDCFIVWPSNMCVEEFKEQLNSLHPEICFTMDVSENELPFLDVLVKLENNQVSTDLFSKPTDAHNYLDFYSNHSKHIKTNIPFNLASRIITIVSNSDVINARLNELRYFLKSQHYPDKVIDSGIKRAIEKGPFTTRIEKNRDDKIIPFISTYNPLNLNMYPIIRNRCEDLKKTSVRMRNIFSKHRVINCKRQPKNLKQILCRSKFESQNVIPCVSSCNTPRCGTCKLIIQCSTFVFKNGFKFTVRENMNCKSKNVIYAVVCDKCSEFYVGQTGRELRQRMTLHRQQTVNDDLRFLNVNKHIHNCANNKFKVIPIYQMHSSDVIKREIKESQLIKLLKPSLNSSH